MKKQLLLAALYKLGGGIISATSFLFRKLNPINIQEGCVVAHVTTSYHARFVSKNLPDSLVKACQVRWWK